MKQENRVTNSEKEFDRQVENLLEKGYPDAAGVSRDVFRKKIESLREKVAHLSSPEKKEDYIPFVIVIKNSLVSPEKMMERVNYHNENGIISMYPRNTQDFMTIENVEIPDSDMYLLVGIDRGKETLNIAPQDAFETIKQENRSPLTIDEGMAIITQFPEFLQKNNCFSLLASRCGDKRVPAIWISEQRPKLGWCWDGNPHTWLGSASCDSRLSV